MAERTSSQRVVVLRKTKLGESDLILTMLAKDGAQLRAVAKGARKPSSPFSTRLELYAVSDILLAQGRSLGIVKEARLVSAHAGLHADLGRAACAAPLAELLWRITQEDLAVPRLFDLTDAALDALEQAPVEQCPRLAAASLLKALAFCGFRPSLSRCVVCGNPVDPDPGSMSWLSVRDGGVVCASCRSRTETVRVPGSTVLWARALLGSTFDAIRGFDDDQSAAFSVLRLAQQWAREHAGCNLKSLTFLFTSGLF